MDYNKTLFSSISNIIFLILAIFALSFIWVNFYLKRIKTSIIIAILITLAFCILFFPIKSIFNKKNSTKIKSRKSSEYLKNQIILGNNTQTINTISKAFNLNNLTLIAENHYIDLDKKLDFYFYFNSDTLLENDIIQIIKNKKFNTIQIFCIDFNRSTIIENTAFIFYKLDDIKKKLIENNLEINYNINILKKNKYSAKEVFCTILNKHKSKNYFSFGLLLIFSSLFTIFSTYYIVMGTILLLLSLYCRFNKRFN